MMHNKYMIFSSFLMSQTMFLFGMDGSEERVGRAQEFSNGLAMAVPAVVWGALYSRQPKQHKPVKLVGVKLPEPVSTGVKVVHPYAKSAARAASFYQFTNRDQKAPFSDQLLGHVSFMGSHMLTNASLDHYKNEIMDTSFAPYLNDGLNSMHHCSEAVVSSLPSVMQGPTRLVVDSGASLSKEGLLMYGAHKLSNTLLNNDSDHAAKTSLAALVVGEGVRKLGETTKHPDVILVTNAFGDAVRENAAMTIGNNSVCDKDKRWGIVPQGLNIAVGTTVGVTQELVGRIPYVSELGNRITQGWSPERRALMKGLVSYSFKIVAYGILHLLRPYLKPLITGK
jgi:hypothetical protein